MPRRPCEAITIRSHFCFLAVAMMASAIRSPLAVTGLTFTSISCPAALTAFTASMASVCHCFSMRATSEAARVTPPSK